MAIRTIVKEGMIGDDILHKVCRPVEVFDEKLHTLLDDMRETLHAANGYGLAAPQVGIMRRVCVVDAEDGYLELVNPVDDPLAVRMLQRLEHLAGKINRVVPPDHRLLGNVFL